ncbi:hypothetical protein Y032_0076g1022 [Ancylostoma ceylanicum]|uniref:Uncharacterized protein n=1 Tax=Ancylostoma ceylanicum TaxID=53326 RepID=A0A016TUP3_9BILA|nr:hypothetical protein Y032_0076g1022 [Ancylostoma ceylanicum]
MMNDSLCPLRIHDLENLRQYVVSTGGWCEATFNCMVFALNRVIKMMPPARRLRFLFQGNLMFMWMFLSVLFMVGRAFFTRPTPYNTVASAYVGSLMITDDLEWVEYLELSFKNKKI